jgi:hypothetical protein
MARWVLIGSYVVLNFALIDLIWGNGWLSSTTGVAAIFIIVVGWLFTAYFLFGHLQLTTRGKTIGWFSIAAFVGYTIARRFGSYYFIHGAWLRSAESDIIGVLLAIAPIALAALMLPKQSARSATPYTVESEAPDHVLHVDRHT